jgi:NAD+ synthase (glutamine-hydrolysing)
LKGFGLKIAICQINTTVGDFNGNADKILASLKKAKADGCALALFPELTLTGYPPRDLLDRASFLEASQKALETVAQGAQGIVAVIGTLLENKGQGNRLFNSAVAVKDGQVLYTVHKTLLPNYDVFDEARYFAPAPEPAKPFEYDGLKIGITICEDIWNAHGFETAKLYQRDPLAELAKHKPDVVLNLSASPFHAAKLSVRKKLLKTATETVNAPVVYCNLVGGNDELIFDGNSMVTDVMGNTAQLGKSFEEDYFIYDTSSPSKISTTGPLSEIETIHKAIVLGTRDYVRKCGFEKVLIGLSGGIDSALVAAIAVEALGSANVMGVTMPSPFSSIGSIEDSRQLAKTLQIEFKEISISPLFEEALKDLTPFFEGKPSDSTEENIQARLRGITLMALSNKLNRLVLSTGNKSEIAVGYCTLYGDMCGGLAVISDIPKVMVYELAKHINQKGEIIPNATITKPPSAELRPNQKDRDSLPPYETLDAILRLYVEENQSPEKIVKAGFDVGVVKDIIKKINQNEYKRRQMAPGLKVTTKAFGMGRRIPIAQKFKEK